MSKVFIDCGAHDGCSVRMFAKCTPDWKEFDIYSFECNPDLQFSPPHGGNVMLIERAVWINNDETKLYMGKTGGCVGSSVFKSKTTGGLDKDHPITVQCIDLSKWIMQVLDIDDFIILKLNIEGAEYQVINKMIDDGSIRYINSLYGEWHWHKIGMSKKKHQASVNRLKGAGLEMKYWQPLSTKKHPKGRIG